MSAIRWGLKILLTFHDSSNHILGSPLHDQHFHYWWHDHPLSRRSLGDVSRSLFTRNFYLPNVQFHLFRRGVFKSFRLQHQYGLLVDRVRPKAPLSRRRKRNHQSFLLKIRKGLARFLLKEFT